MKVSLIRGPIRHGKLPQCSSLVSDNQLTLRLQDWRTHRYGKANNPYHCRHGATVLIDGKPYCARHAGQLALAYVLQEKANAKS